MTIILWIIAAPFIFIFALYLLCVGSIVLMGAIAWVLQRTWKIILVGVALWAAVVFCYSLSADTALERASGVLVLLALILMFADKFLGFPDLRFKKKPAPGTALDTMEARVLRTIRARHPLMCLTSTYGDLENQPCFAGGRFEKIVHEAYQHVHGDCQENCEENITLATALRSIDGILEYETQRVRPLVKEYLAATEREGEKPVEVIDIRG